MVAVSEARSRRLLVLLFTLASICALLPIWAARALPLRDLPQWLDALAVARRYGDAGWGYSRFYMRTAIPLGYWGYFQPVALLARVIPVELANKVYLSIHALLLPVSMAALARQMGRNPLLVAFVFPLVFNAAFNFGLFPFYGALVLLMFSLAALDAFLTSPTRRRAAALALLALALPCHHVAAWLFLLVAAPLLLVCHGAPARRHAIALALLLPSLPVAIVALRGVDATRSAVPPVSESPAAPVLLDRLHDAPVQLITGFDAGGHAYWLLLVLALAWIALFMSARAEERDIAASPYEYRLELLFALALFAYFVAPARPLARWTADACFMPVVALLGALLPVGALAGRRRCLLIPVYLISISYPIALALHWHEYDAGAAEFRALMGHVPRGSSTLVLAGSTPPEPHADPAARVWAGHHAYAQYLAGGYDPWAFGAGFPVAARAQEALPAPPWGRPDDFIFSAQGRRYDYIVTRGESRDHALFGPDDAFSAPLVERRGDFRLYEVRR